MPITEMTLKEGIFYVREEGSITREDAHRYTEQLIQLCKEAEQPIVILVDAMDASGVSLDARKLFARVTSDPKHGKAYVACNATAVVRAARVIGMMSRDNKTYVYDTLEEARQQAQAQAQINRLPDECNN